MDEGTDRDQKPEKRADKELVKEKDREGPCQRVR